MIHRGDGLRVGSTPTAPLRHIPFSPATSGRLALPDDNDLCNSLLRIFASIACIIIAFGIGFAIGLLALIVWLSR